MVDFSKALTLLIMSLSFAGFVCWQQTKPANENDNCWAYLLIYL